MAIVRQWDLSQLGTLGGALGDATRFAMYKLVVGAPEPVSAAEAAAAFGLHRTVARSHLEKLAHAGLLVVDNRRNPCGGRPAKVYSPSGVRLDIQLPPRRYEALAGMLARLADASGAGSSASAQAVGYQCGCEIAADLPDGHDSREHGVSLDGAMAYLATTGCSPRVVASDEHKVVVEVGSCLYPEVARDHPGVVCELSSGLLCGLLGVDPATHRHTRSILNGDATCVHEFALPA
jgi:predicted ArsR family transcriptional regulator